MTPEQEKQQAERGAIQKAQRLRQAAITIAEDKHGNDAEIIKLKHLVDDAELAEKKFQDELNAIRLDTQLARAKYEKALDTFVDPDYQLSDKEWEKVFSRFTRG